jgi:hypothetical protein
MHIHLTQNPQRIKIGFLGTTHDHYDYSDYDNEISRFGCPLPRIHLASLILYFYVGILIWKSFDVLGFVVMLCIF